jgi:agmatine deiminase
MSKVIESTPRLDGYRMPGEFEPHYGCWMLWPERTDNWRFGAKPAQKTFVEVATTISRFENVTMGVSPQQYCNARAMLPSPIRVVEISNNDSWIRDCGPTFVTNDRGGVRVVDWDFNAWGGLNGGLYFPWDKDDLIAQKIAEMERLDRYKASDFVLEGGSIHVDGEGTLLTTEQCLLNPNRNPHLSKVEIEQKLASYLNIHKFIWLDKGVYNDETSGHVDNLCCFLRPAVVALTWTDNPQDPQYEISLAAFEMLNKSIDAKGRAFEVVKIQQPGPLYISVGEGEGVDAVEGTKPRREGDRMAGSYINFYIANGGAVVPTFNLPTDQLALETLSKYMPERQVVGVHAREILLGGGNIHCITQQQVKG